MAYDDDRDEFDAEIKADDRYAQIIIKITDSSRSEKEAEKLIETLNIHIVAKLHLSTHCILFRLNGRDMRDAALKLTEHGFIVKGINAVNQGK